MLLLVGLVRVTLLNIYIYIYIYNTCNIIDNIICIFNPGYLLICCSTCLWTNCTTADFHQIIIMMEPGSLQKNTVQAVNSHPQFMQENVPSSLITSLFLFFLHKNYFQKHDKFRFSNKNI